MPEKNSFAEPSGGVQRRARSISITIIFLIVCSGLIAATLVRGELFRVENGFLGTWFAIGTTFAILMSGFLVGERLGAAFSFAKKLPRVFIWIAVSVIGLAASYGVGWIVELALPNKLNAAAWLALVFAVGVGAGFSGFRSQFGKIKPKYRQDR